MAQALEMSGDARVIERDSERGGQGPQSVALTRRSRKRYNKTYRADSFGEGLLLTPRPSPHQPTADISEANCEAH